MLFCKRKNNELKSSLEAMDIDPPSERSQKTESFGIVFSPEKMHEDA